MKLGLILGYSGAELRIPLEDVKLAEQLGYDSVWTAEAYGSDAITPLAHIAAHTDRIRLGTAVLQLAGRTLGERPPTQQWPWRLSINCLAAIELSVALASQAHKSLKAGMASLGKNLITELKTTSPL